VQRDISVEAQRAAEATGIPRLSAAAEAAIGTLRAAPDENARGEAWRAAQKNERVAAELGAFRSAVERRFGDESVRQMLRTGGRPGAVNLSSVAPEQQPTGHLSTGRALEHRPDRRNVHSKVLRHSRLKTAMQPCGHFGFGCIGTNTVCVVESAATE